MTLLIDLHLIIDGIRGVMVSVVPSSIRGVMISVVPSSIRGVMVSVVPSSAVDCRFKHLTSKTKDNIIGICCFSTKHAAFRSKSQYWLAQNQDNVFEWSDMFTVDSCFNELWYHYENPTQCVDLVQSEHHHLIKCSL
jgi:hypothetical protein